MHVICEPDKHPFSVDRPYTPPPAPVKALAEMLGRLQMERVVIVTPAVYGDSNECTLEALGQLGARARGIALLGPQVTKAECERMRRGGIRGLRLNFETLGVTDPGVALGKFKWASRIAAEQEWHIQINTRLQIVEALEDSIAGGDIPVVFDHFAQAEPSLGAGQAGFPVLVRLLKAGRAYVKISAAYRISRQPPPHPDVTPLAQALIAANPERVLWGSDWPHPDAATIPGRSPLEPRLPLPVDDVTMLSQLAAWAPDPAVRHAILVENPARLYDFELIQVSAEKGRTT